MATFEEIKQKVETIKRDVAKAEGALEQQLRTLKAEFNCDSLDEARDYLTVLAQQLAEKSQLKEEMLAEFTTKYETILGL